MCINYFLISAHLSNFITSDNRDPNNALNSDVGVVWGLLCLHPNTIKPRYIMIFFLTSQYLSFMFNLKTIDFQPQLYLS